VTTENTGAKAPKKSTINHLTISKTHYYKSSDMDIRTSDHFLVLEEAHAEKIAELGYSASVILLEGGLNKWTPKCGVAVDDVDDIRMGASIKAGLDGSNFIFLVPGVLHYEKKFGNLVKQMAEVYKEKFMITVMAPRTPADATPESIIEAFGEEIGDAANRATGFHTEDLQDLLEKIEDDQRTPATKARILISENYHVLMDQEEEVYLVPKKDISFIGRRAISLGSPEFAPLVSGLFDDKYKTSFASNQLSSLRNILISDAMRATGTLETHVRTYKDVNGTIFIDLGRKDCQVVRVNADGWGLEKMIMSPQHAFIKNEAVLEHSVPEKVASVTDALKILEQTLRPILNVRDEDWSLIVGYMVNHLIAENISPILMLLGTNGSGKSTASNAITYALEGGKAVPNSLQMGSKADDILVTLSKHKVGVFDNITQISGALSDVIVQIPYGKDYEKRKLFTNNENIVTLVKSSLIMNGISTGQLRDDIKDRMVVINLAGTVGKQTSLYDLKRKQIDNHSRTFGALLTLVSAVLRVLKDNTVPEYEARARMDDYFGVLWALDYLTGSQSVDRYLQSLQTAAEDALDDPLLTSIVRLIVEQGGEVVDGKITGLLGTKKLVNLYNTHKDSWPERFAGKFDGLTNRAVPDRLSTGQATWNRLGVKIIFADGKQPRPRIDGEQQVAYAVEIDATKAADLIDEAKREIRRANGTMTVADLV